MPTYNDPPSAQPAEVSPWERAHRTLDQLVEEMRGRAAEIEHAQARLSGELDAVQSVLQRIAPPAPQSAAVPSTPYPSVANSRYGY